MASRLKGTILMLIIIVVVAVALFCHILALVTNSWLKSSDNDQQDFLHLGLWTACFENYRHRHELKVYNGCHDLYSKEYEHIRDWLIPSWLVVCRILAIIALVIEIVAMILLILLFICVICKWLTCDAKSGLCERILLYATPIAFIVAGVFLMMVVMIFADNAFRLQCKDFWLEGGVPNSNHLSYSWVFELLACIMAFISGGFLIWVVVLKGKEEI